MATGDAVPEVVPLGLFTWDVSVPTTTTTDRTQWNKKTDGASNDLAKNNYTNCSSEHTRLTQAMKGGAPSEAGGKCTTGRVKRLTPVEQSPIFCRQQAFLKRQRAPIDDDSSKLLVYKISFTKFCGVHEDEIEIHEYVQPSIDIVCNSCTFQTISSPMAHILIDYRVVRRALVRREYADAWNTQAKLLCSYTHTRFVKFCLFL